MSSSKMKSALAWSHETTPSYFVARFSR